MRDKFLTASLVTLLIIGVFFTTASMNAVGACYVEPCYLATSAGKSFQVTMTGFLMILQPAYGLYFLRRRCSQTVGGAFIGATLLLALLAGVTGVLWASEANAAAAFVELLTGAAAGTAAARASQVHQHPGTLMTFRSLSALAWAYGVLGLLCYGLLCWGREFFCADDHAVAFARRHLAKPQGGGGGGSGGGGASMGGPYAGGGYQSAAGAGLYQTLGSDLGGFPGTGDAPMI